MSIIEKLLNINILGISEISETPNNSIVEIDISNKDKAEVLSALYNSYIRNNFPHAINRFLTHDMAQEFLEATGYYIDSIDECIIQIDFNSDIINVSEYDKAHGCGSAERAISTYLNKSDI